jgi:Holliday junction resolvase RusA-like endonuclease
LIKPKTLQSRVSSPISQQICSWYKRRVEDERRDWIAFAVPGLPPTINKAYIKTRWNVRLSDESKTFKEIVRLSLLNKKHSFKPTGTIAVVIQFCSPHWVTKKYEVRKMDLDNRVKILIDAVKEGLNNVDDSLVFEFCSFKVVTRSEETRVYLYDLGEVVEYFI